ncbi:TPA: hypothetical protein ACF2WO_003988 [Escherichia coli]|nr:hypothetical protein [Escherichia coli]
MNNNQNLKAHALRTAVLRYYIADAFISLMARVHNEPVYTRNTGEARFARQEKGRRKRSGRGAIYQTQTAVLQW